MTALAALPNLPGARQAEVLRRLAALRTRNDGNGAADQLRNWADRFDLAQEASSSVRLHPDRIREIRDKNSVFLPSPATARTALYRLIASLGSRSPARGNLPSSEHIRSSFGSGEADPWTLGTSLISPIWENFFVGDQAGVRILFRAWLYPSRHQDLKIGIIGSGGGDLAVTMGHLSPAASIYLFDDATPLFASADNIHPMKETRFESRPYHRDRFGNRIFFDRIYFLFPPETALFSMLEAIGESLAAGGRILFAFNDLQTTRKGRSLLDRRGLETWEASIPAGPFCPGLDPILSETRAGHRLQYLLVARFSNAWNRRRPTLPIPDQEPPLPPRLKVGPFRITNQEDRRAFRQMIRCFGQPVLLSDLLRGVSVNNGTHQLTTLSLRRENRGVKLEGIFSEPARMEIGARFGRIIHRRPNGRERWISTGAGFTSKVRLKWVQWDHSHRGIARRFHQNFFLFLALLGVDEYQMGADKDGSYVWPHLGFDFAEPELRIKMVGEFKQWMRRNGVRISTSTRARIDEVTHAWELADFADETGRPLGKEFLLWRGKQRKLGPWGGLVFRMRPDFKGWSRLFKTG